MMVEYTSSLLRTVGILIGSNAELLYKLDDRKSKVSNIQRTLVIYDTLIEVE